MITMVDEIFDRSYQAGRSDLHNGISRLASRLRDSLTVTFEALHRIEWQAPWNAGRGART